MLGEVSFAAIRSACETSTCSNSRCAEPGCDFALTPLGLAFSLAQMQGFHVERIPISIC
jgi:hypothetical protein